MLERSGHSLTLTRTSDIIEPGEYFIDTKEAMESGIFLPGDYDTYCTDCPWATHTCVSFKEQFESIFKYHRLNDQDILDYLTASIQSKGQIEPGRIVRDHKLFSIHNGHHRFHVCHILKLPYFIAVELGKNGW